MERGKPPYKISGGPEKPKGHPMYSGHEQFGRAETYEEALAVIGDLTDYGLFADDEYIVDSEGKKVLDMAREEDKNFLKSLDTKSA